MTAFAEVYDRAFADKDYAREAEVAHGMLGPDVHRVLEVGCGTGNHSAALAARGLEVHACEVDDEMFDVAVRKHIDRTWSGVRLYRWSVTDLPSFTTYFDGAVALFDVVNYCATSTALFTLFQGVWERLRPGAWFVFDAWNYHADPPVARAVGPRVSVPRVLERTLLGDRVQLDLYVASGDELVHRRLEPFVWKTNVLEIAANFERFVDFEARTWAGADVVTHLDRKVLCRCRRPA